MSGVGVSFLRVCVLLLMHVSRLASECSTQSRRIVSCTKDEAPVSAILHIAFPLNAHLHTP